MSIKNFNTRIKLKHDIVSNWTNNNPILLAGEFGWDSTNNNFKIGSGTAQWNVLPYALPAFGNTLVGTTVNGLTTYQVNVDNSTITFNGSGQLQAVGATLANALTIGSGASAVSFDGSAAATIKAGDTLKETISGTTVTFDHADITVNSNAGEEQTPVFGGTFNIPAIAVDTNGHVTNNGIAEVSLPKETDITIGTVTVGAAVSGFTYTAITSLDADGHEITPTTVGFTVPTTTTVADTSSASDEKLPTEKAVRTAIDSAVTNIVAAEGDTYVSATAANNKVTVSATNSTMSSLGKADTALQSVSANGDTYITATFTDKTTDNTQTLNVALNNIETPSDSITYSNTNLALAGYVDEKVAGAIAGGVKYKGTTGSTLPANPENGDMYKTTEASAASVTPAWKAGDVIIYHTTGTPGWDVIPAGDDVEYTGIKVGNTTVISATVGGDAGFAAGITGTGIDPLITVEGDGTSHTVTYKSTTALETAVANANSAVQTITAENALNTTDYIAVSASRSSNVVTLSSSITAAVVGNDLSVSTHGIVTSGSIANIKFYVDALGTTEVSSTDTEAGVTATLGGTVSEPTITLDVTGGSIVSGDTSVVTGGTVFTAIEEAKDASAVTFGSAAAANNTAAVTVTQGEGTAQTVTLTGSDTIGITGAANTPTFAVKENSIGAEELEEYICFIFDCGGSDTNITENGLAFTNPAVHA